MGWSTAGRNRRYYLLSLRETEYAQALRKVSHQACGTLFNEGWKYLTVGDVAQSLIDKKVRGQIERIFVRRGGGISCARIYGQRGDFLLSSLVMVL